MSCHRKVTHYRDGFGVKNKWTETCGLLSLLHLGLLFCHINIRTGPHYTPLPRCDGSAGSAPRTVLGCAGEPHPGGTPPAPPPGTAREPAQPRTAGVGGQRVPQRAPAPAIPAGLPTAFPSGMVASPPFTRARSARTLSPLSKSGDVIHFCSVFFPPWGPQGQVAGCVQDRLPGELATPRAAHEAKLCAIFSTWKTRS